jgi:hypothetical protein
VDEDDVGAAQEGPEDDSGHRPDRCFGAFACSICQAPARCGCIVEEPDRDGRMVCASRRPVHRLRLCVTLGNPTAPQQREFGCPPDYDAINMMPWEDVLKILTTDNVESQTQPVTS